MAETNIPSEVERAVKQVDRIGLTGLLVLRCGVVLDHLVAGLGKTNLLILEGHRLDLLNLGAGLGGLTTLALGVLGILAVLVVLGVLGGGCIRVA